MPDPSQNQAMSTGQMLAAMGQNNSSSDQGGGAASGGGAGKGLDFNAGGITMEAHSKFDGMGDKKSLASQFIGLVGDDEKKHFANDQDRGAQTGLVAAIGGGQSPYDLTKILPTSFIGEVSLGGNELSGEFQGIGGAEADSGDGGGGGGGGGDDSAFSQSSVSSAGMEYEGDVNMAKMGGFTPDSIGVDVARDVGGPGAAPSA